MVLLPSEARKYDHRYLGTIEILRRAARLYRQGFGGLLGLSLICLIVPDCIELALRPIPWSKPGPSIVWIVALLRIAGLCLLQGTFTLVCALGLLGVNPGILNVIRQMKPALFLRMLGTALIRTIFLLLLYLALIVPGLIYTVRWAFSMHVVMLERRVYRDAMRRSSELLLYNFWRLVGIISPNIIFLAGITVGEILEYIDLDDGTQVLIYTMIGSLLSPLIGIASTLLYFDIRVRNEGLEVETARKMIDLRGNINEWELRWERA